MLCRLTHKNNDSVLARSGLEKQQVFRAVLVMEKAKEGAQSASALALFPTQGPSDCTERGKGPVQDSRHLPVCLAAFCTISENQLSPFSLPREGSGSP